MNHQARWRVLAALCVARIGMGFQFQTVAATAPLLSTGLGFDPAQIGWLVGLYLLPGVVLSLPGGMLGARFGDKRMAMLGLALMLAGGLGFAGAQGIVGASLSRVLMGMGSVVLNVMLVKMVTDWFAGKEMVLAMAILMNTWPIGIGIALLTQGALAQALAWQAAFVATAIVAGLGMLCVGLGYNRAPGAAEVQKVDLRSLEPQERVLLGATSLPWMLYNAAYVLLVAFLPLHFVQQGMSLTAAGGLTAINTILTIISVLVGAALVQRYGHADRIVYASLAAMVLTVGGLLTSSQPLAWIVASGVVMGLPAGVLVSLPGEVLRPESRSTGMGVFFTLFYAGVAVAPYLGGVLAVRSASSAAPIWLGVACVVACAAGHALVRSLQRAARGRASVQATETTAQRGDPHG